MLIFAALTIDETYMARCLSLAQLGAGYVSPNPKVGAVIVYNNTIIGEGYHERFGGHHAEVNAINSVINKELLKDSTLYINLEPCCHWGKTPPCTSLILETGIKDVKIGCLDPNPLVSGDGIKLLKESGIAITTGILEPECSELNEAFFEQFDPQKELKFTIKWAESMDGFMGKETYNPLESKELSNALVKRFVHKLRSKNDAILIGTQTALIDNPRLDNRYWYGSSPKVVIIDKQLKIPLNSAFITLNQTVIILNNQKDETIGNVEYCKINFDSNVTFWETTSQRLLKLGIITLLIEGGSYTIQSFFETNLPCLVYKITTPTKWEHGIFAPKINANRTDYFYLGDNLIELYS